MDARFGGHDESGKPLQTQPVRFAKFRDNSARVEVGGNRLRRELKLPAEVWKSPLKRAHFDQSVSAPLVTADKSVAAYFLPVRPE